LLLLGLGLGYNEFLKLVINYLLKLFD